jgi:transposase-like protein
MSSRQCKQCRRVHTVTSGTIFHRSRHPLKTWFDVAWQVCEPKIGISALTLQRAMDFGSFHTAWEWSHRMRRLMVIDGRAKLSGTVEVDEAFIGGVKPGIRGRGAIGKAKVFVAAEDRGAAIGRIRLLLIPDTQASTLLAAVDDLIDVGSHVVSDGYSGYQALSMHGYMHTVATAATMGKNVVPKAHRVIALLKRWLLGTHQGAVNHDRLQSYLDEFVFRFNRRAAKSRGLLFHRLMEQAAKSVPIKGAML